MYLDRKNEQIEKFGGVLNLLMDNLAHFLPLHLPPLCRDALQKHTAHYKCPQL